METKKWCEHLRVHYAKSCIIPSTLRGQVEKGGSDEARVYIEENVFLDDLAKNHATPETFTNFLDRHTNELKEILVQPKRSKSPGQPNFGAARKVINIFLRLCCMNKDLNHVYKLHKIEGLLEIPLDKHVVTGIENSLSGKKAKNFTIRDLTPQDYAEYQIKAKTVAENKGLKRYELDIIFFKNN